MKEIIERPTLTYQEAEVLTGICKNTLYAKVSRQEIPHFRLGGRLVRFSRDELVGWLAQHRVEPHLRDRARADGTRRRRAHKAD